MMLVFSIAAGGAIGALLRFASVALAARFLGAAFPWGTLCVNVLGSFLMGLAAVLLLARSPHLTTFVMSGVLGGFTTFSAFSLDTLRLLERGEILGGVLYIAGSVGLSIAALALGMMLARPWIAP